ncbi:MAG: PAS domain S-box protein [Deltaproteobacteria bacterium]|nr:PAS domain S-box protein [Deltaproteobacteria bacterium]
MSKKPTYEELKQRIRELEKAQDERKQTEAALRQSRDDLRLFVDSTPDLCFLKDRDGRYLMVNAANAAFFGKAESEILGKTDVELMPEDAAKKCMATDTQAMEGRRKVIGLETVGESTYETRKIPVIRDSEVIGVAGIIRDVTEQKRAEDALESERAFLTTVINTIEEAIVICDEEGRLIRFNESARRLHGLPEKPIPPDQWAWHYDLYRMDGITPLPTEEIPLFRALQGEHVQNAEIVVAPRNSGPRYLVCNGRAMRDGENRILGAVVAMHDITERKAAEAALKRSEENYRSVFDSANDALFIHDIETGRIISVNQKMCEMYGYSKEEAAELGVEDISEGKPPYTQADALKWIHKAVDGKPQLFEWRAKDKTGRLFWVEVNLKRAVIGGEHRLLAIVRDIGERKRAEAERERLQARLSQAQKMESIGTLAGGIAHNFNNILMGIQGRASLMKFNRDPSHSEYEHIEGVEEYVKSAVELTRDLLGFARGGKYEVKPTNLNALIQHENEVFGRTKKEIQIQGKYEKDLWSAEVDKGQIRQALLNLYINAWQAMPAGGELYIQTENVQLAPAETQTFGVPPGRYVKISVTDTGTGMDEATREKIFDPFFSTKDTGQGSGLGLASVYGIIKNHNGFINVYSEKGEGTTFTIFLPASEKDISEKFPEPPQKDIQYGKGTILLVDDEDMVIEVAKQMLETLGYRVLIARNGREALNIYAKQNHQIDLVILDMIMPGMGGGDVHDRMREINESVNVVLSSGYSINGQAQEIIDRGCSGFIQKPFSLNDLSIKVGKVLKEKRA